MSRTDDLMAQLDIMLTYAVPVKVELLGAHLEAHLKTWPTIEILRLCNRFGKGPATAVQRLPVELLQHIESFLVADARAEVAPEWQTDFQCFEQTCRDIDHLDRAQKQEYYDLYLKEQKEMSPDSSHEDVPLTAEELERVVDEECCIEYDDIATAHYHRTNSWLRRVGGPSSEFPSFFANHTDMLQRHFGLEVWASTVRNGDDNGERDDPAETTVAYLILPRSRTRSEWWQPDADRVWRSAAQGETGYGVPVTDLHEPSENSLRRFQRALRILGLEVWVSRSQKGKTLGMPLPSQMCTDKASAADTEDRAKDKKGGLVEATGPKKKGAYHASSWPQLTLLMRGLVQREAY